MKSPLASAALLLAACSSMTSTFDTRQAAESLAAAESAFAAHSVREDMRAAFLAAFAADGVLVRDGWKISNDHLAARPAPPIVLDWRPAYVEVAGSGELGLSTGPWKLTSKTDPKAASTYGQFVSVWRREAGGPWKVAVDLGIGHPEPSLWQQPLEIAPRAGDEAPAVQGGLERAEAEFDRASRVSGARAAYAQHASDRIRFYRDGSAPAVNKATALAAPAMDGERLTWTVERVEIARSGDFGYARGRYAAPAEPAKTLGYYLRVWRLEQGVWRIALDVVNPARRT